MPLIALATMSGRTKLTMMSCTAELGLAGQPCSCTYSASFGSMAYFGLLAQIGCSAKLLSGGWLDALLPRMEEMSLPVRTCWRAECGARSSYYLCYQHH